MNSYKIRIVLILALALPVFVWAQPAMAKTDGHLFILSGQSNMRGPLPQSFEEVVSKVFGKENVTVVTNSHPSQPIRHWYKNWTPPEGSDFQLKEGEANGVLYDKLLDIVRKKVGDQQFSTVTFVWMQGEADGHAGWGAVYEKSFLGIIDQLKADFNRDDIRFVLGRINDHRPNGKFSPGKEAVREAQVKLGEANANGAWVNTDDLNAGINPWSVYETEAGARSRQAAGRGDPCGQPARSPSGWHWFSGQGGSRHLKRRPRIRSDPDPPEQWIHAPTQTQGCGYGRTGSPLGPFRHRAARCAIPQTDLPSRRLVNFS
jgi:hypothetical protein